MSGCLRILFSGVLKCTCGQCGFDADKFLAGQAAWFIRHRTAEGVRIWKRWTETKPVEYMAELKAKIEEVENGNKR